MNTQQYTQPATLEKYSFLWSQARLVIASVALFLGGIPPVLYFMSGSSSLIYNGLKLAWIISGVASVYMLYRWNTNGRMLFGAKIQRDTIAFFVSVVSGINLGIVGLLGSNIGMSFSSSKIVFIVVGILYLISAYHLQMRWSASAKKIF